VLASTQSLLDSLLGDRPPERALSLSLYLSPHLCLSCFHHRAPVTAAAGQQHPGSHGREAAAEEAVGARLHAGAPRFAPEGPPASAAAIAGTPLGRCPPLPVWGRRRVRGHRWPPPPSFSPAGAVASVGSMRAWLRAEEDVRRKEAVTKWIQHSLEGGGVRIRRHGSF
jgi:hypothetical protein